MTQRCQLDDGLAVTVGGRVSQWVGVLQCGESDVLRAPRHRSRETHLVVRWRERFVAFKVVQSWKINPGQAAAALDLAKRAHALVMKHGCKVNRVFTTDIGGERSGEFVGEFEFGSMTDWANWRTQLYADPEAQAILGEASTLMMPGTLSVVAMTEVPLS